MFDTLDELRASCSGKVRTPAYLAKMMHPIATKPVVDRTAWILAHLTGQTVLDVGASGQLHRDVVRVAAKVYGLDRDDGEGVTGFDLDDVSLSHLPYFSAVTRVVCGEVIEHLSNPGHLLTRLRKQYPCPLVLSVPNAFTDVGRKHLAKGFENVNKDHVAWYSPKTLEWLLGRAGYHLHDWAWYNGQPLVAEGIVALAE